MTYVHWTPLRRARSVLGAYQERRGRDFDLNIVTAEYDVHPLDPSETCQERAGSAPGAQGDYLDLNMTYIRWTPQRRARDVPNPFYVVENTIGQAS